MMSALGQATASVTLEHGRVYRLRISGRLPPLWAGNLATGLAAERVGILSGSGRGSGLDWNAELLLDFGASSAMPEAVNYLGLAETSSGPSFGGRLRLSRFTCNRLASGMLEVRVYGPDQPGFLAQILGQMAVSVLFLAEFDLNTRGDEIEDRFLLIGMGGLAPSAEVQQVFEQRLRALCAG